MSSLVVRASSLLDSLVSYLKSCVGLALVIILRWVVVHSTILIRE